MVDARLHKADVVAHDEENVGLLVGRCLRGGWPRRLLRHRLRLLLHRLPLFCLHLCGTRQHGQGGEDGHDAKT
jgi:hypothetical protein